jgi:putative endonuclease
MEGANSWAALRQSVGDALNCFAKRLPVFHPARNVLTRNEAGRGVFLENALVSIGFHGSDLIARRGGILALIEVKTRSNLASAGEAITARQRARIARAAEVFLQRHPDFSQLFVRFDVILIARRRLPRHLMDAWRPGDRD